MNVITATHNFDPTNHTHLAWYKREVREGMVVGKLPDWSGCPFTGGVNPCTGMEGVIGLITRIDDKITGYYLHITLQ